MLHHSQKREHSCQEPKWAQLLPIGNLANYLSSSIVRRNNGSWGPAAVSLALTKGLTGRVQSGRSAVFLPDQPEYVRQNKCWRISFGSSAAAHSWMKSSRRTLP